METFYELYGFRSCIDLMIIMLLQTQAEARLHLKLEVKGEKGKNFDIYPNLTIALRVILTAAVASADRSQN